MTEDFLQRVWLHMLRNMLWTGNRLGVAPPSLQWHFLRAPASREVALSIHEPDSKPSPLTSRSSSSSFARPWAGRAGSG